MNSRCGERGPAESLPSISRCAHPGVTPMFNILSVFGTDMPGSNVDNLYVEILIEAAVVL